MGVLGGDILFVVLADCRRYELHFVSSSLIPDGLFISRSDIRHLIQ
jgi:hypothetical protein